MSGVTDVVRVTIRRGKGTRSFLARIVVRCREFTIYLPLDRDGQDKSYRKADGSIVVPEELIASSLIVSERPCVEDPKYGGFKW
jgi:hypothetical protein